MQDFLEIYYKGIKKNAKCEEIIKKVAKECFEEEKLNNKNIVLSIILTNSETIKKLNSAYRSIDKETDVLSFPMFKKEEVESKDFGSIEQVLGDIIISIEKVEKQAVYNNHSFERELSYMVVHGFYHLMGYDHVKKEDKENMRKQEEKVLKNVECKM